MRQCHRCTLQMTHEERSAGLVNIVLSAAMEILCLDYLSLERSKGGNENILVITDHFPRYAQAFPTRNRTARTTPGCYSRTSSFITDFRRGYTVTKARPVSRTSSRSCVVSLGSRSLEQHPTILWGMGNASDLTRRS